MVLDYRHVDQTRLPLLVLCFWLGLVVCSNAVCGMFYYALTYYFALLVLGTDSNVALLAIFIC